MPRMRQLKMLVRVTQRENQSFDRYIKEIDKVKLLTAEEEVVLARRIKQGDTIALEQLTKANLRFVVSVAKQYQGQGLGLQDLINEGNLGLIKAAERFDETRGFKFISYAVWWIRQQILQSLAENSRIVRLPLKKISLINNISRASAVLEQEHERQPSENELAKVLDITLEEVKTSLSSARRHLSMDAPLHEDGNSRATMNDVMTSNDLPNPLESLMIESLRMDIDLSLNGLTGREAEIIRLYFGLNGNQPHTLEEIGHKFELTRERVRQIKEQAIVKLRRKLILRKHM